MSLWSSIPTDAKLTFFMSIQTFVNAIAMRTQPNNRKWSYVLLAVAIVFMLLAYVRWTERHHNLDAVVSGVPSSAIGNLTSPAIYSYLRVTNASRHIGTITIQAYYGGKQVGRNATVQIQPMETVQKAMQELEELCELSKGVIIYNFSMTGDFEGSVVHLSYNPGTAQVTSMGGVFDAPRYPD